MQSSSTLPSRLAHPDPGRSPVPGHLRPVLRPLTGTATASPPTPTTGRRSTCTPPASSAPRGCVPAGNPRSPRSCGAADCAWPTCTAPTSPCPHGRPPPPSAPRSPRRCAPGAPAPPAGLKSPTTSPVPSANASTAPEGDPAHDHARAPPALGQHHLASDRSGPGRPARRPRPPRPGRPRHPHPARLRPRAGHPPPLPARRPGRGHRQVHLRNPHRLHPRRRRHRPAHPARHQRRSRRR